MSKKSRAWSSEDKISIVIPVYNEEGNIIPLLDELFSILFGSFNEFEVIVVDDGSKDNTKNELSEYKSDYLTTIFNEKNSGQSAALFLGIKQARHDVIVLMDGDMQYDPADIPVLNQQLRKGARLVSGVRSQRHDTWSYRIISRIGNPIIKFIFGHSMSDIGCGLKITYKENLDQMTYFNNIHRYIGVLYYLNGHKVTEMEITHRKRLHGKSKYSILKVFGILKELAFIKKNFKRISA